jgi:hypothetical protein
LTASQPEQPEHEYEKTKGVITLMKKCLGLSIFVLLFAAVAAQAGTCSDCLYCESGDYCGYRCAFNGSYANCAAITCNVNMADCPVDNSLGDCNYRDSCGCWFFMQMYWTSRRPTQQYDAHQWRLVSARVTTPASIVRKRV